MGKREKIERGEKVAIRKKPKLNYIKQAVIYIFKFKQKQSITTKNQKLKSKMIWMRFYFSTESNIFETFLDSIYGVKRRHFIVMLERSPNFIFFIIIVVCYYDLVVFIYIYIYSIYYMICFLQIDLSFNPNWSTTLQWYLKVFVGPFVGLHFKNYNFNMIIDK